MKLTGLMELHWVVAVEQDVDYLWRSKAVML